MGIEQIRMNQTKALPPVPQFNWSQIESSYAKSYDSPVATRLGLAEHQQVSTPWDRLTRLGCCKRSLICALEKSPEITARELHQASSNHWSDAIF